MANGALIIAGGALNRAAAEVFAKFVEAAGGPQRRFAVLPAATTDPAGACDRTRQLLSTAGVPAGNVACLRVSGTVSGWECGASDAAVLEEAECADGIWMPGGDQNAITRMLLKPDGSDTPLLAVLRRRLAAGAIIGGTSAGAAVMCDPMIGAGTSLGALLLPHSTMATEAEMSDALCVTRGLGLFPFGLVDQHFDARARLGRLVEAAMVEDDAKRLAFGIAEDSAMVCDMDSGQAECVGVGGIHVVDVRRAVRDFVGGRTRIRGVMYHYLTPGDTMNLRSEQIKAIGKTPINAANRTFAIRAPLSSGVLSPYGRLADFVGAMLMDNDPALLELDEARGSRHVSSLLVESIGQNVPAWEIQLGRMEGQSRAWYGSGTGFEHVVVDFLPVEISVRSLDKP